MAEDKKTKQELEVQAKIANDFKLARNEADKALKASYSAEIQALLAECSKLESGWISIWRSQAVCHRNSSGRN